MTFTQASGVTLLEELSSPTQAKALQNSGLPKRIELRASEDFIHALDLLAQDENLSRADIIRRAVGLYTRIRIEQNHGRHLALADLVGNELQVRELITL
jgi:hypothetical protein